MKSVRLTLIALFCSFNIALTAQVYFTREYSAPGFAQVTNHINCYDGGFLIVNNYEQISTGTEWLALIKTDSAGTVEWTKVLGPMQPLAENVIQTTDSGFVLCYVEVSNPGYQILKLDQQGNVIYLNLVNGVAPYKVISKPQLYAKNGGGFFIAGDLFHQTTTTVRWQILEFDVGGNMLWSRCYYESPVSKTPHVDFDTCNNGDLILAGTYRDSIHAPYLTRLTSTGNVIWSYRYQLTSLTTPVNASSVVAHPNGQISFIAYTINPFSGRAETIVIQTTDTGSELWSLKFYAPVDLRVNGARSVENCNTALYTGYPMLNDFGAFFKIDTAGFLLAGRQYIPRIYGMSVINNQYHFTGVNSGNGRVSHFNTDLNGVGCNDTALFIGKAGVPVLKHPGIEDTILPMTITSLPLPLANDSIYFFHTCSSVTVEEQETHHIRIFPNPAGEFVTINSQYLIHSYELQDINGRMVKRNQCNSLSENIAVGDLADGMYLLKVFTDQQYFTQKVVISR